MSNKLARKALRVILRQYKPKIWLGGFRDLLQRGQSYFGLFNAGISLATLYTVREAMIKHYMPWATFLNVLYITFAAMCILLIVDYKIIHPSQTAYLQHEAHKRNPMRKDIEKSNERQKVMEQRQDEMDKKLDKILGVLSGRS